MSRVRAHVPSRSCPHPAALAGFLALAPLAGLGSGMPLAIGPGAGHRSPPSTQADSLVAALDAALSADGHCVAYQARKRVAFLRTVRVVGTACDLDVRLVPDVAPAGGADAHPPTVHLEVTVPVRAFSSGNRLRDRHVRAALGAPAHNAVQVVTTSLPLAHLEALVPGVDAGTARVAATPSRTGGWLRVPATLTVAGVSRPVEFDVRLARGQNAGGGPTVQGIRADVVARTSLSALGVTIPPVGPGGVVARPLDEVTLFARVRAERIAGLTDALTRAADAQPDVRAVDPLRASAPVTPSAPTAPLRR